MVVSSLYVLKSIIVECMEILESFGWIALGFIPTMCVLRIAWKVDAVKSKSKYKSEQGKKASPNVS
jgi:hypothetical protein